MRVLGFTFLGMIIIVALLGLSIACGIINTAGWFIDRSVTVVKQQIDPAELLRKYELFKDESATLDSKLASINSKKVQIDSIAQMQMDRTNREQLMIWRQELEGMKYSYNALAADYNSQMSKINYAFTNVGDLPKGATTPLPREYKPYIEQ